MLCTLSINGRLTNGSFNLVPSSDPDLDARPLKVLDRLWHTILQPIFDGGGAQKP